MRLCSNGFSTAGITPTHARDRGVDAGITVNALVILDDYDWLERYFARDIIGGTGAFVCAPESLDSFSKALLGKLVAEIALAAPGPGLRHYRMTRTVEEGRWGRGPRDFASERAIGDLPCLVPCYFSNAMPPH